MENKHSSSTFYRRALRTSSLKSFHPERRVPVTTTSTRERECLFEVKDLEPTNISEVGRYDGYARIRTKLDEARRKFKEYQDWPCAIVLYNHNAPLVDVNCPEHVLGAMNYPPSSYRLLGQ